MAINSSKVLVGGLAAGVVTAAVCGMLYQERRR
jgi:hypothetical protein